MHKKLSTIVGMVSSVLLIFLIVNAIHFRFGYVRVVLYDAVLDAVIAVFVTSIIFYLCFARTMVATREEAALSLVVGFLLTVLYALSVPTIIDRSLSIYMLEKLSQRDGSILQSAFEEIITKEYVAEHQLVGIRLTEQLNSGTISIKNGCVTLTARGRLIATVTRLFRTTMLPKKREIMGRYSDELTDPFRNSTPLVPFRCD